MAALNVLFVCTGNTCRSPMAAALAADIWAREGISVNVRSCGISAGGFMPASVNSVKAMQSMGLDISGHTSQGVSANLIAEMDLVLTMTYNHKNTLAYMFNSEAEKIYSLAEYSGSEYDVADPYGADAETYLACAVQIKDMIEKCTAKLR